MDATFSNTRHRQLLLLTAFALIAGPGSSIAVNQSLASDSSKTSTIIISDSNPQPSNQAAPAARGSITFVAPAADASFVVQDSSSSQPQPLSPAPQAIAQAAPKQARSARADLVLVPQLPLPPVFQRTQPAPTDASPSTVAASPQPAQSPQAVGPSGAKQPSSFLQAASRKLLPLGQNRGTEQQPHATNRVQPVQHQESEADIASPSVELLVAAHALSLQAQQESEYTQIVDQASQAVRMGADKEQRQFAHQLISWALNRRGQLRADSGLQEQADADFRAAIDNNPNNWRALHNRGVTYAQLGFFAEAFDDFNRVTQLNPKFAKGYANRATLFVQANDLQSALDDYQHAAQLNPNLSNAQVGIARVLHMLGRWDEALAQFEVAVHCDPTNAEILCSRGDLLADMGRYGEALADYARTVEVNPQFAHAYRNGSWLLATCPDAKFRDAENALLGAQQALQFDYGQRHVALDTLAAAQANAGQFASAIKTLQDALAIAPEQSKIAYTERLRLYQQRIPYRTEPVGEVSQVIYEATDR
ncbi:MAG: tetratricopeptide repeat protein [Planctomycetales bacterium]|nr:tetratricopeptide repeat protein [Planctomycetales bacterium]